MEGPPRRLKSFSLFDLAGRRYFPFRCLPSSSPRAFLSIGLVRLLLLYLDKFSIGLFCSPIQYVHTKGQTVEARLSPGILP